MRTPGTSERFYRVVGAGWKWTDRAAWTPENWADWESRVETHVAYSGGVEAGYVELDPAGLPDSAEIAYLGLLPGFEGHGLGGHLLTFALRRGFALAPRVWVHTCSLDGPHALTNYRARGLELFRTEVALRWSGPVRSKARYARLTQHGCPRARRRRPARPYGRF